MGRTGKFFAHEWAGVKADIISLAKGLANGVPIGAVLATNEVAQAFVPGSHGCTFGGNFLSCAAAIATLDVLRDEIFADAAFARDENFPVAGRHARRGGAHISHRGARADDDRVLAPGPDSQQNWQS